MPNPKTLRTIDLEIARRLFPDISPEIPDENLDRYVGIDAYSGDAEVWTQIKIDTRIRYSGAIYHEVYEKTVGNESQPWRTSLGKAELYVFITPEEHTLKGFRIKLDYLANKEREMALWSISPNNKGFTSLGFRIPISTLNPAMVETNQVEITNEIKTLLNARNTIDRTSGTPGTIIPPGGETGDSGRLL